MNEKSATENEKAEPQSPWLPIYSAPKRRDYKESQFIDILAKRWEMENDKFEFRRFADCYWVYDLGGWQGVANGWLAVAWMHIPVIPNEYPPSKKG